MKTISASVLVFAVIFASIFLLHLPLLRLPYFWDEAGYYIPAARDLLLSGSLIPHSTPSNAHPPLVMGYLALCWKLAGYSPLVTRTAMLLLAAFALWGVFRLARRVANLDVAVAATACTALYPVFFAQSSIAHVDLAAAGLTIWGFDAYVAGRRRPAAAWFSLGVLAKETALLAPLALLVWDCVCAFLDRARRSHHSVTESQREFPSEVRTPFSAPLCLDQMRARHWPSVASLLTPAAVLSVWYAYHFAKTGYVFGNPEFFRYNVAATLSPLRIVLALGMRLWQAFGYLHLWVLTLLMVWAMTRPPLQDGEVERPRIELAVQLMFGVLVVAYVAAMSVIGGAVLARYMLTVVPLVVILAVSTLRRRIRRWPVLIAVVLAAFTMALFRNPPYGFAPEDNLAYRDYVEMHQCAESFLETRYAGARVLTAWPASDEISRPYLGYVARPLTVVRIEDFTLDEVMGAAQERARFDVALVFSTKYEPARPLLGRWRAWEKLKTRFFGFHRDLPPEIAAQLLGGRVVFIERRSGQWVAVIELERTYEAINPCGTADEQPARGGENAPLKIPSPVVFAPSGDLSSNQMHKDSVMGRGSFAISLASDGPIPLDSQPGSVLGEKHLVYRDLHISKILEILKDRALHVLLDHVPSGIKQLSVRQPIIGSDSEIALFPRLRLTVHERTYLRAVVLVGFLCPAHSLLLPSIVNNPPKGR